MSKTNRKFIKLKVNSYGKVIYKNKKQDSSIHKVKQAGKSVDSIEDVGFNPSNREKAKANKLDISKYDDVPLSSYFEIPVCKHPN